jgi:hypothetical protein
MREKVGILILYKCSTLQNNNSDGIPKSIMNYNALILAHAPK